MPSKLYKFYVFIKLVNATTRGPELMTFPTDELGKNVFFYNVVNLLCATHWLL